MLLARWPSQQWRQTEAMQHQQVRSWAQLHLAAMLGICVAFWDVLAFSGLGHLWDGCSKSSRPCFSLA